MQLNENGQIHLCRYVNYKRYFLFSVSHRLNVFPLTLASQYNIKPKNADM